MSNVFPRNIASPPPIAVAGQGCYLYDEHGKNILMDPAGRRYPVLGMVIPKLLTR